MHHAHRHPAGIVRREFLQVGFSGFLGLGLGHLGRPGTTAQAASGTGAAPGAGRARSMVLVFLTGGPSHIDTFDPKPDAPEGIRGEFQTIATKAPGLHVSEHLPGLAARADRLAVVRSLSHANRNHLNATHQVLTGHPQPGAFFDKIASRDDFPCYASALEYLRPSADGLPCGILLPTFLMEGPLIWPGQHAGFLGPRYDPWQIRKDPNKPDFQPEGLSLPVGFSVERLEARRQLQRSIQTQADDWLGRAESAAFDEQQRLAYELLLTRRLSEAFDLDREPPAVRDRYGRHMFGQSLLLARRLVDVGVPIVQANMGRVQNWDSHNDNFRRLRDDLLPPLDQGVSALLDDLAASGKLDETLVVVAGEFGRTPRVGQGVAGGAGANATGRDHWPSAFSAVFAGAGVVGGQAVGSSDASGAYPASSPHTPADLAATIYQALGIDLDVEVRDRLARPLRLIPGRPIEGLYTASGA